MNVAEILKSHPTFTSHELVQQMCKPLRQFGITYFGHSRIDNNNKCTFICTDPAWASFFLTSDLGRNSLLYFKTSATERILLADSMPRAGKSQFILDKFYHRGYGHLMTILRTYDTHREIFHFAGAKDDYLINNRYLWHLNELKAFINYYKNTAKKDCWLKSKDELRLPIAPSGTFNFKRGYEKVDCGQY